MFPYIPFKGSQGSQDPWVSNWQRKPYILAGVRAFTKAVFSETSQSELLRWNEICRTRSPAVGFIAADCFGLAGSLSDGDPCKGPTPLGGRPMSNYSFRLFFLGFPLIFL